MIWRRTEPIGPASDRGDEQRCPASRLSGAGHAPRRRGRAGSRGTTTSVGSASSSASVHHRCSTMPVCSWGSWPAKDTSVDVGPPGEVPLERVQVLAEEREVRLAVPQVPAQPERRPARSPRAPRVGRCRRRTPRLPSTPGRDPVRVGRRPAIRRRCRRRRSPAGAAVDRRDRAAPPGCCRADAWAPSSQVMTGA